MWSGPGCSLPVFIIEHFCSAVLCWVGVSPETQACPPGRAVGTAGMHPVIPRQGRAQDRTMALWQFALVVYLVRRSEGLTGE